jgi:lipopolysaccharide export LptBFGC system permease protein LptF
LQRKGLEKYLEIHVKRRGGMGVNLAFGVVIAMIYVFFDKVFGVMAYLNYLKLIFT